MVAAPLVPVGAASAATDCADPRKADGSMTEFTYRRLSRIQEDLGEGKLDEAIADARKLRERVEGRNKYEAALVYQTEAFAWSSKENYREAIKAFEAALALDALPQEPYEQMLQNVGQLYYAEDNYDQAIRYINRYLDETCSKPSADTYILLAGAYVEKKQYSRALPHVNKAIALKKTKVPESWYQLKLAIHYEQRQFKQASQVLVDLIAQYPIKEDYWKQLSGVFLEMKDDPESLAVLALAERQGFLDTGKEVENLANVYMFLDIPYKGAEVLEKGLQRGLLDRDLDTLEKLGSAWQLARENDKALEVLTEAAPKASDGRIWYKLGQIHVDDENWEAAESALRKALSAGIDDKGETNLLVGVSAWNQGKIDTAREFFRAAGNFRATRDQARAWLAHVASNS